MRRSSFTHAQIAEALTFAREEFPGTPENLLARDAAIYLDFTSSKEGCTDALDQVLAYLAREHVEGAGP